MAVQMAIVCKKAPDAVGDLQQVLRLAEFAVAKHPRTPVYVGTLGQVLYRAGQYEAAVKRLEEALAIPPEAGDLSPPWNALFLAMAYQSLNRTAEARRQFDDGCRSFDLFTENLKTDETLARTLRWDMRLDFQRLRQETERMLGTAEK